MRQLIAAVFAAALCGSPALAQDTKGEPKKEMTEQQKRTADCSTRAAAKGLKGRERSQFVSTCLRGGQPTTQQERTAACNKEATAKALKGDDRKKFMSSCLGG